jgi:hypothetical protein
METLHSVVNFNKWRSRSFVYGNKKSTTLDKVTVSLLLKKNVDFDVKLRYTIIVLIFSTAYINV